MRHNREAVIERTIREFQVLDDLLAGLSSEDWQRPLVRPEGKDPWTVQDAVVHITHWQADVARSARGQRRAPEERGLMVNDGNHLVYLRWRDRSTQEVLAWRKQVEEDVLAALQAAPEKWFNGKERDPQWPADLDAHSAGHRVKDIERALASRPR